MALDIKLPRNHPGSFVKHWILPDDMSITAAAKKLAVSRQSLDALVNERRSITPEMALKLEAVFGGTARLLLAMQTSYDLQESEKNKAAIIKDLVPHTSHPSLRKTHAA